MTGDVYLDSWICGRSRLTVCILTDLTSGGVYGGVQSGDKETHAGQSSADASPRD